VDFPLDGLLVLSAGDRWPDEPDEETIGLICACALVEGEVREAEWRALETVLSYVEGEPPDDRLIPPSDPKLRLDLARAIVTLGWANGEKT
jgi:hypothetical protein